MADENKTNHAGRPRKRPSGEVSFSARLPTDLHRLLKTLAYFSGKSLNEVLTEASREWAIKHPSYEKAKDGIEAAIEPTPEEPAPKKPS